MALTSRTAVKALLNIAAADTTLDAWIDALLPAADVIIKSYLGRDLESQSYTEFYTGDNKNYFVLHQFPVTALTTLHFDPDGLFGKNPVSSFPTETLLTEGTDYVLDWKNSGTGQVSNTGIVWRVNDVWPHWKRDIRPGTLAWVYQEARGNIKVTYTAGYTTIPADIQLVVAMLVSEEMKNLPKGGPLLKEEIGDYSYEMAGERMMGKLQSIGSTRQILSRYRDPL